VKKLCSHGFGRRALLCLVKIDDRGMTRVINKKILTANVIMQDADIVDLLQDHEKFFSTVMLTDSDGLRTKNRPCGRRQWRVTADRNTTMSHKESRGTTIDRVKKTQQRWNTRDVPRA